MSVALMVSEEEILTVDRVYILPVLKSQLDGRKRRMSVEIVVEVVVFKKLQDLINSLVSCHRFRLSRSVCESDVRL